MRHAGVRLAVLMIRWPTVGSCQIT